MKMYTAAQAHADDKPCLKTLLTLQLQVIQGGACAHVGEPRGEVRPPVSGAMVRASRGHIVGRFNN